MTLTYHTSLQDAAAVISPIVGDGAGSIVSPSVTFVSGKVGQCAKFDSKLDYIQYAAPGNVDPAVGTFEFWMRPDFLDTDNEKLMFVSLGNWLESGHFVFGKHNASNQNRLMLIHFDANGLRRDQTIEAVHWQVAWNKGAWSLIKITWDWNAAETVQNLHLYSDGVELPITLLWVAGLGFVGQYSTGQIPTVSAEQLGHGIIGGRNDHVFRAKCAIDEFKIYDEVV